MRIYSYREPNVSSENAWKDCLFENNEQLAGYGAKTLVAFNDQPVVQQHHTTYITGRDTCHAHHFAKMLAKAVLDGRYDNAPSITVRKTDEPANILWIDTVRGPHACASFFKEMTAQLPKDDMRFKLICMDLLGSHRENFWEVTRQVEAYIRSVEPTLVVIDDIDHLMPHSGINVAAEFNKIVRDTTNHTETAFVFVGYNHLGKRASTTGEVGKLLFTAANSVFSVTTQQAVSRVRLVRAYEIISNILDCPDSEFMFSIAADNLPHEVVKASITTHLGNDGQGTVPLANGFVSHTALSDIISGVMKPGEAISPDELTVKLSARRQQLNRIERSRNLIAQAAHLGIIRKASDGSNDYILNNTPVDCKPDN